MLEVQDITFSYQKNGNQILEHVNLSVGPEERLGILAPSGYGKTTLLKIISGYISPDAGRILVDGELLPQKGYCPVQMIWQHPELSVNPRRRLYTVLSEGDWPEEEPELKGRIVTGLGIEEEWLSRYPSEVSGGELQRFCIARALGKRTEILLADEITTMLDLITQGIIWDFLLKETKRRNMGLVAVSHSEELLEKICTRIVYLEEAGKTQ